MSFGKLEELRQLNKSLLENLSRKREEFRKLNSADNAESSHGRGRTTTRTEKENDQKISEVIGRCRGGASSTEPHPALLTTQGLSSLARKALATPTRTSHHTDPLSSTLVQPDLPSRRLQLDPPEYKVTRTKDVIKLKSPVKRLSLPDSSGSRVPPNTSIEQSPFTGQYVDQLTDGGNVRSTEPRTPKSILVTPNRSSKRDPGHVTFQSSHTPLPSDHWTGRPLLGYDWIAGLLEVNSPTLNKSEQFFSEIGEFRRVNKEECVRDSFPQSGRQDSSGSEEELDVSLDTHQCVYCYRVNDRLFTSPLGPEPACPVCKKRRGRRRTTLEEPAYIRVSIPRSTLLPPYKYRAHRRKSFDPTDTLALPSHCLAGWENAVPSCDSRVTGLDLKTSVDPSVVTAVPSSNMSLDSTSYYASRARSENLLNMSRSIHFHHKKPH